MRHAARVLMLAASGVALSSVASAYYYWTFFPSHGGPFTPVQAKYDLGTLPNKTVNFFISDQGPSAMVSGDSFPALVSQIRAAAEVWNGVATSDLRVKFGGISTVGSPQSAPGIDVVFDDNIPPGLNALTRLTLPDDLSFVATGTPGVFVPIQRATIQFYKNLKAQQQPSYNDFFFTSMVHEFGHALGLQHTLTSSVMSTGPTRGTSKAKPLAADDIAGISLLYPVVGWAATTGTIQGRVVLASSGVNMASVVALSPNGTVISTLSNPDGFYQISGIPPGQYYIYAHPLPPPQQSESTPNNIVLPVDASKNSFPPNIQFDTEFFPGTRDWTQATLLPVKQGALLDGINFSMQPRSGPTIYAVTTYGFEGSQQVAVAEPPLKVGSRTSMSMSGPGLAQAGRVTPGLNIGAIGSVAQTEPGSLTYQGNFSGYDYVYMTVDANSVATATPVALAMTTPTDLFVLPDALSVVPSDPPIISGVIPGPPDGQGNPTAIVMGTNLSVANRIVFDGTPGTVLSENGDGSLTVLPPSGQGSYNATVVALASDGQSSSQALAAGVSPALFSRLSPAASPFLSVYPTALQAGTDVAMSIQGYNMGFVDGQVSVGFGSSDIAVKKIWVNNVGRLLMNVSVSPAAHAGPVTITVVSGLQLVTLTGALQILPYTSSTLTLVAPVTNALTGLAGVPAGAIAVMGTNGLPFNLNGWTLSIGGVNASLPNTLNSSNQLQVQVPAGVSVGVALVQLFAPAGSNSPPAILMQIDGPPPVINAVLNGSGLGIDAAHTVQAGDIVTLNVVGLPDTFTQSQLRVAVGGVPQVVQSVLPAGGSGAFLVMFAVSSQTPAGSPLVTVGIDTQISQGKTIWVRQSDNSSQQAH